MNKNEDRVFKYIKKHKPETQAEIYRALEMIPSVVHHAVHALELMGKIKRPRYEACDGN